jgi:hypothetical protein
MAARDTRTRDKNLQTPSLFDYMDRTPSVKIGGVSRAYVEAATADGDEPADEVMPTESCQRKNALRMMLPRPMGSNRTTPTGKWKKSKKTTGRKPN